MVISKRVGWFLVAFGVWSWIIWPTFLKNIWADHRSWNHGMTAFFGVHLVLTIVSLTLGTIIGVYGVRALRAQVTRGFGSPEVEPASTPSAGLVSPASRSTRRPATPPTAR